MDYSAPTILLIDDNKANLELLHELILMNFPDSKVDQAGDGKSGLDLAIKNDPDIILLDIRMPEMNGFEVCRQLRANPFTEDIPVVFVTAHYQTDYRVKALEAGANGFMAKPVDQSELVAQIKTMQKVKAMNRLVKQEKSTLELLVAKRTAALEKELAERKKAEKILQESEEKFAVAFKTSPLMMGIFSIKNLHFVEVNTAFSHILGYSSGDLHTDKQPALKIWADKKDYHQLVEELHKDQVIMAREVKLKTAGGNLLLCSLSASLLQLHNQEYILFTIEDISERKRQERQIADKELQLQTLAENLPGFFYQLQAYSNDDIRVSHLSKGIERFGITRQEAIENPFRFFDLIRPDDFSRMLKQADDYKIKENKWHEQFQITTPDGRQKWIEVHDVPRIEDDGSYIYNGYAFDITDRKAAEEKQTQSEEQFQKLIESLPVSLSIINSKGEVRYVNSKCRELFEIPDDFDYGMGTAFMYWVNADDRIRWINQIKEQGEVRNLLLHVKSFKGKEIWAYGSGIFIQYKNETCVLSTHQDITQVKMAQDALRQSEEKFSKVFHLSPYAITVTRLRDGKIIEVNDAFTHISGYSKEEATESSTVNLELWANPADRQKVIEKLQKGENIIGQEFEFRHKNGTMIIGSLSMQLLNVDGEPILVGTIEDITQRKHEERELKQSRRNFYSAFISSPVALAISTLKNGELKMVNDSYCRIMEYDREEVIGKSVFDLKIYDQPDLRQHFLQQVSAEGKLRNYELTVRTKNGHQRHLLASIEPVDYDDEKAIIATFIDISDRKKAEAELETNYALLQMAAKTARFGGWSVDLKTNICTWSDAVAEIHEMPIGYCPPVSEGISFYAPEHHDTISEAFNNCAQKGITYDLELQIITGSGKRIWVRTIGEPVKDKDGKVTNVIGSFQDIDEQKNMVAALRESEQKFKSLAENAQVLISIISTEGNTKYLYVNKEWENATGYSKDDLDKITPIGMTHPDMRAKVLQNAQNRVNNKPAPKRYDSKILTKSGETKELDFSAVPIIYENQPAILTAAIDITDRKKTEMELKERMDELERFHRLTVDRELNMIELKKEVNSLLVKLGKNPKYRIVE